MAGYLGGYSSTTMIADEQFIERQRLFEDFLSSDVLILFNHTTIIALLVLG